MKTSFSSAFLSALLASAVALPVFAGPGPQYWARQNSRAAAATPATEPAKMPCAKCTDRVITTVDTAAAGGKGARRTEVIGVKHACTACGGEIKTVQNQTSSNMQANCPICAKAAPRCCKVSG